MLAILTTTGRVLARHWPALMAWYLAGILVHYVITEMAGFVGASSATLGFLVLPIGILARLFSLVAMFLVLRDGLRNLQEVAPLPESSRERRQTFLSALLAGILPFFAVYWGQGLLGADVRSYSARALEVRSGIIWTASVNGEGSVSADDTVLNLPLNVWTILTIVLAFAGRWAWSKWVAKRVPWLSPVAVYFEVVWVFFSVMVIGDILDAINKWVDTRVATQAFESFRASVLDAVAPLRWVWDGIGWVLGEAGPVLIAPLAWLTIAGVVFGQAIVAEKLRIENKFISRFRAHTQAMPNPIVRRLRDLGDELGARFRPIGRALLLMWRAGPLLIASYALVYVAVKALESYLEFGLSRLIGPREFLFWAIAGPALSIIVPLFMEPVRIAVISGAYDATLGHLRKKQKPSAGATAEEAEIRAVADAAGLLPSSIDAVAASVVSAPPRDVVGGQGSKENLTNDPSAS